MTDAWGAMDDDPRDIPRYECPGCDGLATERELNEYNCCGDCEYREALRAQKEEAHDHL